RHTRCLSDWSSDVCSSDLLRVVREVENALERARLTGQVTALERRLDADAALVGASAPMRQLADAIARVAKIPSPVLITGESGSRSEERSVGKECRARGAGR